MKRTLVIVFVLSMAVAAFGVPNMFNYQGKLTDVVGVGVNDTLDMIVRIYDDLTVGAMVDRDTIEDVQIVKGLFDLQYEVALAIGDLTGDLYLELEIEGGYVMLPRVQIAAVPFALAALYVDSAYYSVKADSLGDYVAADFMPNDLQSAYDLDENITTGAGGPVDIRTAYVGPSDGRALELRTKDDVEPTLYIFNAGAGPAIFCSGDLRMNGEIWSNDDIKIHLDKNASLSDEEFIVMNDTGVVVFSVDEHGDAVILGELDPKAVTFQPQPVAPIGAEGKVYYDDTDGNLKWNDGTAWQDFGSGSGGSYIEDQNAAAQDADFWIDGQGIVGGVTGYSEEDVVIGTGISTSTFEPIAGWWRYHREVSLISPTEIGAGGACTLDSISIYLGSLSTTDPWTYDSVYIWMMTFPVGSALPTTWDVSHATQVFNNNALVVPQTATGWVHFDITDFSYDGTSNLFIFVQNGYQGTNWSSSAPGFAYTTVASGNYVYGSSDASWPTALGSSTSRPNFRLSFTDYPTVIDQVTIENGDIDGDGDLTMGGDVEGGSFTLDGVTIIDWPDFITRLDTITATDHDTVVVDEALKVMGELIADSIQAVDDIIYLDDNIEVDGCATFGGGVVPIISVFSEDFETSVPPTGWTANSLVGTYNWMQYSTDPHGGSNCARYYGPSFSDNSAELYSASIDISLLTTPMLSFWHTQEAWGSDQDSLQVYYRTSAVGLWVLLTSYTSSIVTWTQEALSLPSPSADYWIRFVAYGSYGYGIKLDDIEVYETTGAAPPAVEICTGDVTADGDVDGGTFTLNSITITDWPEGRTEWDTLWTPGHVQTDTMVAMSQFKVLGELVADSIQAAGDVIEMDDDVRVIGDVVATDSVIATDIYASNNINANTSMTLNGVSITAWPGGGVTSSLDGAYDYLIPGGGRVILADAGPVFIDATMGDTAISAISASPIDPTAFFQHIGGGFAIETIGDIMVHGAIHTDAVVSTPHITNFFGDTVKVNSKLYANEFVADTIESRNDYTYFKDAIWIEDSIWMDGIWHTTWGGGGIVDFDTINATRHDTVVVSEALKVMGELIADNIQAVGGVITLDDSVYVDGNIEIEDSILFDYDAHIWYGSGSEGFGMYYSPDPGASSEKHNFMVGGDLAVQIFDLGLRTTYIEVDMISGNTASPVVDDDLTITGGLYATTIDASGDLQIDGCATFGGGVAPTISVLSDGFETSVPPTGWTANSLVGTYNWLQDGTDSHSGSYSANFSTSSYGNSAELYTASIDISLLTTPMLSFWHTQEVWTGDQDSLQVYYRTSAGGLWVLLTSYTSSIDTWTQEVLSLTSPSADYWIRFVAYGEWGHGVFIDDIEVYETTGPVPAAVNICSGLVDVEGDLSIDGDATVHGKLTVDGLIDPTGLVLDPQAANPMAPGDNGIYVGTDDKLYYYDGTTTADISGGGSSGGSLQSAYDGGNAIATSGGNAVSITAATGDALYVNSTSGNGIWNDAGYWAPTGNVSLGTGNFHTNSGIYQSNADFIAKIDADDDGDNSFIVQNSAGIGVFSVEEDGDVYVTGGVHDGVGFGTTGQILTTDGSDVSWVDPTVGVVVFDTINATRHDTVVVSEALKIMGELIADSIQAVGPVIDIDDDMNVIGAVSLGGDSTFRNDWEPKFVITVGAANADFTSLDDAIAAIPTGATTLIDIAPGGYIVTGAPTLSSDVCLRGSGSSITIIDGAFMTSGGLFQLSFTGVVTIADANVSECFFVSSVNAAAVEFGFCQFQGDLTTESITTNDYAIFHDCQIEIPVKVSGVCKLSNNAIMDMVTVAGMGSMGEFTGNIFMGGAITVNEADIYAEANLFTKNIEGMEVGPAIYLITGSAEVKANHFVGRDVGAVVVVSGSINMLSNDVIRCGGTGEGAICAMGAITEINILGNHIDGKGSIASSGINIVGGMDGTSGSIKDNIIEGHGVGVILSAMHVGIRPMPIDNNIIYKNQNDGLIVGGGGGNYLIVHNTLYNNNLSGGVGVDLNDLGCALVVSHNVVDGYSSLLAPVPGALNTNSAGNIWVGVPQVGQLP